MKKRIFCGKILGIICTRNKTLKKSLFLNTNYHMRKHQNPFEGMLETLSGEKRKIYFFNEKLHKILLSNSPKFNDANADTEQIRDEVAALIKRDVLLPIQLDELFASLKQPNLVGLERQDILREIITGLIQTDKELTVNEMVLMRGSTGIFWDIEKEINRKIVARLLQPNVVLSEAEKNILTEIAIFEPGLSTRIHQKLSESKAEVIEDRNSLREMLQSLGQDQMSEPAFEAIFRFPLADVIDDRVLNIEQTRVYLERLLYFPKRRSHLSNDVAAKARLFLQQQLTPKNIEKLYQRFGNSTGDDLKHWERIKEFFPFGANKQFSEAEETFFRRIRDVRDAGDVDDKFLRQAETEFSNSYAGIADEARRKKRALEDMQKAIEVLESKYTVKKTVETAEELTGIKASEQTSLQEIRNRAQTLLSDQVRKDIDKAIQTGAADLEQKLTDYLEMLDPIRQDLIKYYNEATAERRDASDWGEANYRKWIDYHIDYIQKTLAVVKANNSEEEDIKAFSQLEQKMLGNELERGQTKTGYDESYAIPPEAFDVVKMIRQYMLAMEADAKNDPYQSAEDFGYKWHLNTYGYDAENGQEYKDTEVARNFLMRPDIENNKIDFFRRDFLIDVLHKSGIPGDEYEKYLCAVGFSQKKVIERRDSEGKKTGVIDHNSSVIESEAGARFFRRYATAKNVRSAMLLQASDALQKVHEKTHNDFCTILEGKEITPEELAQELTSLQVTITSLGISEELRKDLPLAAVSIGKLIGFEDSPNGDPNKVAEYEQILKEKLPFIVSLIDYLGLDSKQYMHGVATIDRRKIRDEIRRMAQFLSEPNKVAVRSLIAGIHEAAQRERELSLQKSQRAGGSGTQSASSVPADAIQPGTGENPEPDADGDIKKADVGQVTVDRNEVRTGDETDEDQAGEGEPTARTAKESDKIVNHEPDQLEAIVDLEVEKRKQALREFARWTKSGQPLADFGGKDKLLSLTDLEGKPIIRVIDMDKWKHGEKTMAMFSPNGKEFAIEIRRDCWEGDIQALTVSIRHEAYHGIDQLTQKRLSYLLFSELEKLPGFKEKYDQFKGTLCLKEGQEGRPKYLSNTIIIEELFAYLLSGDSLKANEGQPSAVDVVDAIRQLQGAGDLINAFKEGKEFNDGINNFVENAINMGWSGFSGRRRIGASYDVPNADLGTYIDDKHELDLQNRRRKIVRKLRGVRDYGKNSEVVKQFENRLNSLEAFVRNANKNEWRDKYDFVMHQLDDMDKELNGLLLDLASDYTTETTLHDAFVRNTAWLSISDVGQMWDTFWKFVVDRHTQNSNMRVGRAGHALIRKIPGCQNLANEFDNKRERTENEKVAEFKKAMEEKDGWEIMERVDKTNDRFEVRAALEVLAKKGAIDWYDKRIWRALEQHQHSIRFIDADAENLENLKSKLQNACAILYDNDFFRDADRDNNSNYESIKKSYKSQAETDVFRLAEVLGAMLIAKQKGGRIPPARYEMYIEQAVDKFKSTPADMFWFILQGINYGLLTVERANYFESQYLNTFAMSDWFLNQKPTPDQVRSIANMFPPTKNGQMPASFMDWFQNEVLGNESVRTRMEKSCSSKVQDHDWAAMTTQLGNHNIAKKLLVWRTGSDDFMQETGYPNVMVGHLQRITSLARENKLGRVDKKFLKESIARQVEYVCTWNSIIDRRVQTQGQQYYSISGAQRLIPPRKSDIYMGKGKKTAGKYLEANDNIIAAIDPPLFELLKSDIDANMDRINNHLKTTYGVTERELPKNGMEFLSNLGGYITTRLNGSQGDMWLEAIMNAALEQYKADHNGSLDLGPEGKGRYSTKTSHKIPPGGSEARWKESIPAKN